MASHSDHSLVSINLEKHFRDLKYEGASSFVSHIEVCTEYSSTKPAIQFKDKNLKTRMYIVEATEIITEEMQNRWIKFSQNCDCLFLVIPKGIKSNAEAICAREISSYQIVEYEFIIGNITRDVKFSF